MRYQLKICILYNSNIRVSLSCLEIMENNNALSLQDLCHLSLFRPVYVVVYTCFE